MTSRLVTVDLILSLSLQLRHWKPLAITEEGSLDFYAAIREMLNRWARQIEAQGLSVSLETIALGALQVLDAAGGERTSGRLEQIGDELIERAREIEGMILNRSIELVSVPVQHEIAKALKHGESVKFSEAADNITGLKNSTEARNLAKEFLAWVGHYAGDAERSLLGEIIEEKRELTTSAVELFKSRNYFPFFNAVYRHNARKRRKI